MIINELVLKISSICNLNCSYCYVFNQGDKSYQKEPNFIEDNVVDQLLFKVDEYCKRKNIKQFLIIFHGGEPLLIGKSFFTSFVNKANKIVRSTKIFYSLQTNGTLLNESWIDLLCELNINVGISLDGGEEASAARVYKSSGRTAFKRIIKGVECLKRLQKDISILSVVNINENPLILYNFIKNIGVSFWDLLVPCATYDKKDKSIGLIGQWLLVMFDLWYGDNEDERPYIRIFNIIIQLLLGNEASGNDSFGRNYNGVVTIKPNGNIEIVDSLKICKDGITRTGLNIKSDSLDSITNVQLYRTYYNAHKDDILCEKCKGCLIKNICGGFRLPFRYSKINLFDNPSVYCADIIQLVIHIQNKLLDDIPVLKEFGMEKLSINDFN